MRTTPLLWIAAAIVMSVSCSKSESGSVTPGQAMDPGGVWGADDLPFSTGDVNYGFDSQNCPPPVDPPDSCASACIELDGNEENCCLQDCILLQLACVLLCTQQQDIEVNTCSGSKAICEFAGSASECKKKYEKCIFCPVKWLETCEDDCKCDRDLFQLQCSYQPESCTPPKIELSPVGGSCDADSECISGTYDGECITTWPGGYCSADCSNDTHCPGSSVCAKCEYSKWGRCRAVCSTASDCESGYLCNSGKCYPHCELASSSYCGEFNVCDNSSGKCLSSGVIGSECDSAQDCQANDGCITAWPAGYCQSVCGSGNSCPAGSSCITSLGVCRAKCSQDSDCRCGYVCNKNGHTCQVRCDLMDDPDGWCGNWTSCADNGHCQ